MKRSVEVRVRWDGPEQRATVELESPDGAEPLVDPARAIDWA